MCFFLFVRVFFRRDPQLIEDVGVVDGRKFIRMYSLSFICCKIATVFFVLLGHIPEFSGQNTHIFVRHSILNNDHFIETGSGQT